LTLYIGGEDWSTEAAGRCQPSRFFPDNLSSQLGTWQRNSDFRLYPYSIQVLVSRLHLILMKGYRLSLAALIPGDDRLPNKLIDVVACSSLLELNLHDTIPSL
jgi:hypothetical protein